jgi:hypothetical protein
MQPAGCPRGSHPLVRITDDSDYESRGSVSNAKPGPRSFDEDRILRTGDRPPALLEVARRGEKPGFF